nr:glycosyl hydrolase [Tessaracoccus coleopterorum]
MIALRYTAEVPFDATLTLASAQDGAPSVSDASTRRISFAGTLGNGLRHAASVQVSGDGGVAEAGDALLITDATELVLILDAQTNYRLSERHGWRGEAPEPKLERTLGAAAARTWADLLAESSADLAARMGRVSLDLGTSGEEVLALPTDRRLARYAEGGSDPSLERMMYDYGRYLLICSSRAGGLPANLQGLWCNQNDPTWGSDYHTNINIQMNYWGAEPNDLGDAHTPLIDFIAQVAEPSRVATRRAFGQRPGVGPPAPPSHRSGQRLGVEHRLQRLVHAPRLRTLGVLARHRLPARHRAADGARDLPVLGGPSGGTARRRTRRPDGVVPEHGPREDGVMHDQQIVWDLFGNYLELSDALGDPDPYRKTVADLQARLAPNLIGRWGQLQEWQSDRDDPSSLHRHTSHLFAVYPGRQISTGATPELAAAALVSLKARCGERVGEPFTEASVAGDSRRSWTWPWRAALFARLGDAERAHLMIRGLLRFNTLPNLWTNHPPFQVDGNFGISGAVVEMLLQSHGGVIRLLPALPDAWAAGGSFTNLRARGGYGVSARWEDGRVVWFEVLADLAPDMHDVVVVVNGERRTVRPTDPRPERRPAARPRRIGQGHVVRARASAGQILQAREDVLVELEGDDGLGDGGVVRCLIHGSLVERCPIAVLVRLDLLDGLEAVERDAGLPQLQAQRATEDGAQRLAAGEVAQVPGVVVGHQSRRSETDLPDPGGIGPRRGGDRDLRLTGEAQRHQVRLERVEAGKGRIVEAAEHRVIAHRARHVLEGRVDDDQLRGEPPQILARHVAMTRRAMKGLVSALSCASLRHEVSHN